MTPTELEALVDRIVAARDAVLARLPTAEVVRRLDAVVRAWLAPGCAPRLRAEREIPAATGYHREMVRLGLRRQMKSFRAAQLWRFLAVDFTDPGALDGFRPRAGGGHQAAQGPRLTVHVCAGNVPGLPAWGLFASLLLRSAVLIKPASGEPRLAGLLAEHLGRADPEIGACVAVAHWPGGSDEMEAVAFSRADAVVASGSDEAVAAVRARVPVNCRFAGHAHRISAAYVGREALAPDFSRDTVERAAADVAWWDQQGCLQPQAVFVESGGGLAPQEFAQELAAALDRWEARRPAARPADPRWRSRWEVRSLAGGVEVYGSTVVFDPEPVLLPTALNRCVRVVPVGGPETAAVSLAPWRGTIQSVAVAVAPERLLPLATLFGEAGATRVTALGRAAVPEAGWHHDGRPSLAELVRWVDVEAQAEALAETYDREVDES